MMEEDVMDFDEDFYIVSRNSRGVRAEQLCAENSVRLLVERLKYENKSVQKDLEGVYALIRNYPQYDTSDLYPIIEDYKDILAENKLKILKCNQMLANKHYSYTDEDMKWLRTESAAHESSKWSFTDDGLEVETKERSNPNDNLSSKGVALTFKINGKKIGECSISAIDTDKPFLYDLEVVKSERGKGYGTKITQWCIDNYKVKELTVDCDNEIAIKMYKKLGFNIIQKFHDSNGNKDRYYMGLNYSSNINESYEDISKRYNSILKKLTDEESKVNFSDAYGRESWRLKCLIDDYNNDPSDYRLRLVKKQEKTVNEILDNFSMNEGVTMPDDFDWALDAFVEASEDDNKEGEKEDAPTDNNSQSDKDDSGNPPSLPDEKDSEEDDKTVEEKPSEEEPKKEEPIKGIEPKSLPKQTDDAEVSKNGIRRKNLYVAFINWAKKYNNKNTFGSVFDKDVFHVTYPFVPEEMRYFYRLANPMLCVLAGELTFFPLADLRKVNSQNHKLDEMMIFAATPNDLRVFSKKDKKVYLGIDQNNEIVLTKELGPDFDHYIQNMIKAGEILNGPNVDTTKPATEKPEETKEEPEEPAKE